MFLVFYMLKKTTTMSHKATITSRVSYMKESLVDFGTVFALVSGE